MHRWVMKVVDGVFDRVDKGFRRLPLLMWQLRSDQEAMSRSPAPHSSLFRPILVAFSRLWIYRRLYFGG